MIRAPNAIWLPGSDWKTNLGPRGGRGVVLHSAEGSLGGVIGRLLDSASGVSWHFTVALDGTVYQHYDSQIQCWHAHAVGNSNYVGIEHENHYTDGAPDHQPFTPEQVAADVALLQWLDEGPWVRGQTLWEHHEVPGNSTSCPSGRVPWDAILKGLNPVPDPTELQIYQALIAFAEAIRVGADVKAIPPEHQATLRWVAAQVPS